MKSRSTLDVTTPEEIAGLLFRLGCKCAGRQADRQNKTWAAIATILDRAAIACLRAADKPYQPQETKQ